MTRKLRLIKERKGSPATVDQIAAMDFAAVKEYRGLTKVERLKKLHRAADYVRALAVIASEIVAMEKPELVAKVDDKYEQFGPFLMELAHAKDTARELMEMIGAAEIRLAIALANVEADEPTNA
ncbi:MAG: hypothetical protein JWN71_1399 [Xanthobacteraceae bacterium]|nr:hypothetical protein [Xanthobacteraceae bacterium]